MARLVDLSLSHRLIHDFLRYKDTYPIQTKEQEREMIEKYRNDRTQLNKLLVLHNARIAFNLCRKKRHTARDYEDMLQAAMLGLAVAAERFDIDRDIKFSTIATTYVFKYLTADQWYYKGQEIDKASSSLSAKEFQDSDSDSAQIQNSINGRVDPSSYNFKTANYDVADEINLKMVTDDLAGYAKKNYSGTDFNIYEMLFKEGMRVPAVSAELHVDQDYVLKKKYAIQSDIRNFLSQKYKINSISEIV